jgi:hypothetical protein
MILGAVTVQQIFLHTRNYGVILAIGIVVVLLSDPLAQDWLYFQHQNGNRPDWKNAFAQVKANKTSEDIIFATRPRLGRHYLGENVIWANNLDPDTLIRNHRRAWFVIDLNSGIDPDVYQWVEEHSKLVGIHDVYMPGKRMVMRVHVYDPTN